MTNYRTKEKPAATRIERREFIKKAAATTAVAATGVAASTFPKPSLSQGLMKWRMQTTWPKNFPGLGTGANTLGEFITKASEGRITVEVYGAGEIVPAFETMDAVANGTIEMGHGAPYYWKGKVPATQFIAAVPFGLNVAEQNAWLQFAGGQDLADKVYKELGCKFFASGNTGVQMGGWFNKEINSVADLKGLKMRMPGIGGEVMQRAGATQITVPASEVFTALQTGAIDAAEWVGPYNDVSLGLHKVARYYYYPGWQEPGPMIECLVNKGAWESLPEDLKEIVATTCQAINMDMQAEFSYGNSMALAQLTRDPKVQIRKLPDDVLALLKRLSLEIVEELSARDPWAKRIQESFYGFLEKSAENQRISEQAYLNTRDL
jgi:TRAP-type mannitol/chloroaromatic compound transport system substrate-binding protein